MTPSASAQAVGLTPRLLALADLPAGYSSTPSTIIGAAGEFNAAVPASVPVAFVTFYDTGNPDSYDEPVYFGVGVGEELGLATSSSSATNLAEQLDAINLVCHQGTAIPLPGTAPAVDAREFALASPDTRYVYAIAFASKGPYVVQLTWGAVQLIAATTNYVLPPPAAMAQQLNAALSHLPV
jgi:hypothetical protein